MHSGIPQRNGKELGMSNEELDASCLSVLFVCLLYYHKMILPHPIWTARTQCVLLCSEVQSMLKTSKWFLSGFLWHGHGGGSLKSLEWAAGQD